MPTYLCASLGELWPLMLSSPLSQYGWIGEWIRPKKRTVGAMDLGGASTQITFETSELVEDSTAKVNLRLYGQTYQVYTHSFLCYGRDQILKRLLSKVLKVSSWAWQCWFTLQGCCKVTVTALVT